MKICVQLCERASNLESTASLSDVAIPSQGPHELKIALVELYTAICKEFAAGYLTPTSPIKDTNLFKVLRRVVFKFVSLQLFYS